MLARLALALLCFAATFAFSQDSAPPPSVTGTCETCQGAREALLPCDACEGDGKAPCVECSNPYMERMRALQRRTLSPENLKKLEELEKARRAVGKLMSQGDGASLGVPGRIPCIANCDHGAAGMTRRACKVCDRKGWLPCVTCKSKGESPCTRCEGKKRFVRACPECAASGKAVLAESLGDSQADRCTWCAGTELRECGACDAEGKRFVICRRCAGTGRHACPACGDTRKAACTSCTGSGDVSPAYGPQKPKDCGPCKAKGLVSCTTCKRGTVECSLCKGAARSMGTCDSCLGAKKAACEGCVEGSTRSWSVRAEQLASAGRAPLAVKYLEAAVRREEETAAARMRVASGPEHERVIEAALAKRRTELQARMEQLKKQGS